MKLTKSQVEARLSAAWKRQAHVAAYRVAGNRYLFAARNDTHWMPLASSWEGGRQVFEPATGDAWPELDSGQERWAAAVRTAEKLASAYFTDQRNRPALVRLPRAMVLAEARNWQRLGDEFDTWTMQSQSSGGLGYSVNGACTCPDFHSKRVPDGWCKHRIARALAKRAGEILLEEGAGGAQDTPAPTAPNGSNSQDDSTTAPYDGQAQQIDLVLAYRANEVNSLAHINANGELVRFLADGVEVRPPVETTPELYRWLQAEGYQPDGFKWLAWKKGLRQRLQTYVREEEPDPAERRRGLFKLFKEERPPYQLSLFGSTKAATTYPDTELPFTTIRELPPEERPVNRIHHYGPASVSSTELIAILLGHQHQIRAAYNLMGTFESLQALAQASASELQSHTGVGHSTAARIKAGFELGRRLVSDPQVERPQVRSPADAANLLMSEMMLLEQEHLRTILLDTKNRVIRIVPVYVGSLNTSLIRVGEIFKDAIRANAASIIGVHNHPSGDPTPSPEDVHVTRQIVEAGKLLDIEFVDHLIIGRNRFVSLKERGLGWS